MDCGSEGVRHGVGVDGNAKLGGAVREIYGSCGEDLSDQKNCITLFYVLVDSWTMTRSRNSRVSMV